MGRTRRGRQCVKTAPTPTTPSPAAGAVQCVGGRIIVAVEADVRHYRSLTPEMYQR